MTTADFTLAVAVQNIVWGLSQAPIGAIADRFGLPATMVAGAATYVVGPSVMADSAGTTGLLVSGGLIGVALSCTASSRGLTAVARAVSETRRSKMLGVAAVGSIHTLLVPPATQELLTHQAWQIGVLCFLIPAVVMLPAGFWPAAPTGCREVPGPRRRCAVLREAARHRPFLVMSGPIHAPALAICGQDPMLSAEALAVIGGMNSIGSPLAGRYPKHTLLGLLYILRAFAFIVYFMMPPTPASTLVFAAAMGGLWLSGAPHFSGMVAEVFGTRYMATLLGIAFVMHQVGSSGGGRADLRCVRFLRRRLADGGLDQFRRRMLASGPRRRRDPRWLAHGWRPPC